MMPERVSHCMMNLPIVIDIEIKITRFPQAFQNVRTHLRIDLYVLSLLQLSDFIGNLCIGGNVKLNIHKMARQIINPFQPVGSRQDQRFSSYGISRTCLWNGTELISVLPSPADISIQ